MLYIFASGIAIPNAKGNIGSITITDGGKYYENPPSVDGNPPDSVRATGTAQITGTQVSGVTITNQGRGYVNVNGSAFVPSVTFSVETFVGGIKLEDGEWIIIRDYSKYYSRKFNS